ncbi:MAG: D-arabinono-1,4-lactone oxidase [Pseudomonadales bacterium]|jgi:FAD/FMN-containing dehydrogenase
MVSWKNWSGRRTAKLDSLHFIRSEEDAVAVAGGAKQLAYSIRVAGSGHSHSKLVPHDSMIVDASGLAGVISVDAEKKQAWVWSGSKIYSLGRPLHDAGLALKNMGDIDRQAIAGACATGTHGTGKDLRNLSSAVIGARIATASGELLDCSATQNPELWQIARLNLGALGIVTRLRLQLRESYKLIEAGYDDSYDNLAPQIDELVQQHDRFEFFWHPQTDQATVKVINETDADPEYPLAEEGGRQAWSYEVLPSHRPHFHTEMEYSIPAEKGTACFAEIRDLLHNDFPDVMWPVEYRAIAEDDVWLSMAYGRPTVSISVHQDIRHDETDYYNACEKIFAAYDGRPHWGKVNYLDGQQMERVHPRWKEWWAVRDQYDPDGIFLNEYLSGLRPA